MKAMLIPKDGIAIFAHDNAFYEFSLGDHQERKVYRSYVESKMAYFAESDDEEEDIIILEDISKEEAISQLRMEYKKRSVLDYLLIVLNPTALFNLRQEALDIIENLLKDNEVYTFLKELIVSEESLILNTIDIQELQKLSDKVGGYKLYSLIESVLLD